MSMNVVVTPPEASAIIGPAQGALEMMRSLDIDSAPLAEYVATEVRKCATMHAALDEQRKSITKPLDEAKANVMDLFRPALELLDQAKRIGSTKLVEYQRKVEEERRRQQAEADAAARRERERLEREARAAQERAAQEAAELRRKADEAASAGRAAEAEKLEARADSKEEAAEQKAQHMQAEAAAIPATVLIPAAPKLAGISSRENWDFEITDAALLPREFLIPDEKAIRGVVKAMKGKTSIPGVRVFDRGTVAVRT